MITQSQPEPKFSSAELLIHIPYFDSATELRKTDDAERNGILKHKTNEEVRSIVCRTIADEAVRKTVTNSDPIIEWHDLLNTKLISNPCF